MNSKINLAIFLAASIFIAVQSAQADSFGRWQWEKNSANQWMTARHDAYIQDQAFYLAKRNARQYESFGYPDDLLANEPDIFSQGTLLFPPEKSSFSQENVSFDSERFLQQETKRAERVLEQAARDANSPVVSQPAFSVKILAQQE